jgi:hypothetical protein
MRIGPPSHSFFISTIPKAKSTPHFAAEPPSWGSELPSSPFGFEADPWVLAFEQLQHFQSSRRPSSPETGDVDYYRFVDDELTDGEVFTLGSSLPDSPRQEFEPVIKKSEQKSSNPFTKKKPHPRNQPRHWKHCTVTGYTHFLVDSDTDNDLNSKNPHRIIKAYARARRGQRTRRSELGAVDSNMLSERKKPDYSDIVLTEEMRRDLDGQNGDKAKRNAQTSVSILRKKINSKKHRPTSKPEERRPSRVFGFERYPTSSNTDSELESGIPHKIIPVFERLKKRKKYIDPVTQTKAFDME